MKRLTIPNWDYNDMSLGTIGPCLTRLAAYEDTGLEPEQVHDMMTDWVVWKEAEAGGRLIVLPCKVGDTIYILRGDGIGAHPDALKVKSIGPENSTFTRWLIGCVDESGGWNVLHFGGYGRTVFRTREEAEAALGGDGDG